jgi:hypothetical protein
MTQLLRFQNHVSDHGDKSYLPDKPNVDESSSPMSVNKSMFPTTSSVLYGLVFYGSMVLISPSGCNLRMLPRPFTKRPIPYRCATACQHLKLAMLRTTAYLLYRL